MPDDPTVDPFAVDEAPAATAGPAASEVDEEILGAQEQLGKTLDMARAGEDRGLAMAVRDDGEHLVRVLFGLLRMTRTHDLENDAFVKPITEFVECTGRLMELLGAINMVNVEDQIYINDIRIRFDERVETGRALGELTVAQVTLALNTIADHSAFRLTEKLRTSLEKARD